MFKPIFFFTVLAVSSTFAQPDIAATPVVRPFSPELRVPFPYRFVSRGVDVRVNSVEFTQQQLHVSVALDSPADRPSELQLATLMEARLPRGRVLRYVGHESAGQIQPGSRIRLNPGEKRTVTLLFNLPPGGMDGDTVRIQFRSGKWWSSKEA